MTHEPECIQAEPTASRWPGDCICDRLRAAYRRGYNDHARSQQHWQDTHGAYRLKEPAWPFAGTDAYNQHGEGENP